MKKCIELARLGEGKVSPNPLVGCVIVDENGEIISQGYHQKFGEAHAEQNALRIAGAKAKDATLYVNLEPCNHVGKTPPCAKMIVQSGIKRVIIGTKDPNTLAAGGIETLKNAGIEIITGVLENECKKLNEIFFYSLSANRPFVAIKTATTLDGKIAAADGSSKWITSGKARDEVQRLRNKYDAILTTSKTVKTDNPSLTCRMQGGRNPIRVVVDRNSELTKDYKIFNDDGTEVIVFSGEIGDLMSLLHKKGIKSVLVEAGGIFNAALIASGNVNKIYQFIAPKILGDTSGVSWVSGLNVKNINKTKNFIISTVTSFEPDIMLELYPDFS